MVCIVEDHGLHFMDRQWANASARRSFSSGLVVDAVEEDEGALQFGDVLNAPLWNQL
jgi:hypothetical protein